MLSCRRLYLRWNILKATFVCGLSLLLLLAGCGSDDQAVEKTQHSKAKSQPQQVSVKGAPKALQQGATPEMLHETGVELFTAGLSSDDPAAIMQATAMLEEAVIISPEKTEYWVDLADAYMLSDIPVQYPFALDIYWMLLQEKDAKTDIILARLADAYFKQGDFPEAFEAGRERLKQAQSDQVKPAAYDLAYLAIANRSQKEAISALKDKSEDDQEPAYLLLVASLLEESSGNRDHAVDLIDKALQESNKDSALSELARSERRRMAQ